MLSMKVLLLQGAGDFLKKELREQVEDERAWSQKLFKLYRTIRKLEQRKYNGSHFAREIKKMTSYYAVKHMLYPLGGDEDTSIFSENASSFSPRKFTSGASQSPGRSRHQMSVNSAQTLTESKHKRKSPS